MADTINKAATGVSPRPFRAGAGGTTQRGTQRPDGMRLAPQAGQNRSAYQQRLDEIKVRIVDLSHRNMENALRILRGWMKDA